MRAVIQRANYGKVTINNEKEESIVQGLVILIGIEDLDNDVDIEWLTSKIARLRIFDDENGVMNKSVMDIAGEVMVISQFTLHASTKKGNRPSYIKAAKPDTAIPLYNKFILSMEQILGKKVAKGQFGANMEVELVNNGPVTIVIDTKNKE